MAVKRTGPARKAAKKKVAAKKTAAKKKVAKQAPARKSVAKKSASKKAPTKKAAAKKTVTRKTAAKKTPARKAPAKKATKKAAAKKAPARKAVAKKAATEVVLLSGGNPQIAKGFGKAPVKAYIAAMPGWKRKAGAHLDRLIERAVPQVYKAVKWNSPLYGIQGEGWFIGIHCFNEYIKVAFFRGASLDPPPPGPSTQKWVRYLNLRKEDAIDEAQFMDWVKQASQLPGEKM